MSQHRPKPPLDTLQGMINAILIETGKALRAANKERGRPQSSSTRLRSSMPGAIEHFHQALDDLETDIIRAKSVLSRDLEELRTKRIAAENPPPQEIDLNTIADIDQAREDTSNDQEMSQLSFKQERVAPEAPMTSPIASNEVTTEVLGAIGGLQGLSPPSSTNGKAKGESGSQLVSVAGADPSNEPSAGTDSADLTIDLFGDLSGNNNADTDLNFDMDFFNDANTHDNSQTQHADFDFSIGNNTSQDFSMPDLQTSHEPAKTNSNSIDIQDDLFGLDTTAGGDLMDLEATGPAHESAFDDMFIDATQTDYDDDFFFGSK